MKTYIPSSTIDEILKRSDILEVARCYLQNLKKKGANYWALSPIQRRKNTLIQPSSRQTDLQLLRIRQEGECYPFSDGDRSQNQ